MYISQRFTGQICSSLLPSSQSRSLYTCGTRGHSNSTLVLISALCEDAAFKILNPKAVPKFFRLNSHNAILEFLLEVVFFFLSSIKPSVHFMCFDSSLSQINTT